MNNPIQILDSVIDQTKDGRWQVSSKNIRVTYLFDAKYGLRIDSFVNLAGSRPVQYILAPSSILPFETSEQEWQLVSERAFTRNYGGRETAQLELTIAGMNVTMTLHVVAFPGTSVLRQWFEIKNTCIAREASYKLIPFHLDVEVDDIRDAYRLEWVHGGNSTYEHGLLYSKVMCRSFSQEPLVQIQSNMTAEYIPLVLLARNEEPCDGVMAALEYCGPWEFEARRLFAVQPMNTISLTYTIDRGRARTVNPLEAFTTPVITLAAYAGDRDNLMVELYDWQYQYLWDYTNPDYFAKTRTGANWIYCTRNLHDQFAYRTAVMSMAASDWQRAGYEILWDDAGWSSYPGFPPDSYGTVFHNTYEGPDYRMSQRYFKRCGIKWLLWFAGKPSLGILENKEGAWGTFEWRTDALSLDNSVQEKDFKDNLVKFISGDIRRSFHTCSGGSTYSHTFDIQRYATYNYIADLGVGPYMNYYFSFFEVPDKWGNLLAAISGERFTKDGSSFYHPSLITPDMVRYIPEFSRSRLSMVPLPSNILHEEDIIAARTDLAIYKYLIQKGVAGKGSYLYHPKVYGDAESFYLQRLSHDHLHGMIILRHRPTGKITIFPRGLLNDAEYIVGFQNSTATYTQSGKALMEDGILIEDVKNGELIYLNLPDRPGSGTLTAPPPAPQNAVYRREQNIGYEGTGIYWTPCPDEANIESYEVTRNGETLCRIASGTYWFDRQAGWSEKAAYAVRAINTGGVPGEWKSAARIPGEIPCSTALGNHSADMGKNGWYAECSEDLKEFHPMQWVNPAACPFADFNGTPNQVGGTEGYWEGGKSARIGRGWMQASPDVYCIRKYVMPENARISISGRAMKEWYHRNMGCKLAVCILRNEEMVLPWKPLNLGDLYGAAHHLVFNAMQGDELRFVLGKSDGVRDVVLPHEEGANLVGWVPVITKLSSSADTGSFSLRINCGGGETIDACGNLWLPDAYFNSGEAMEFASIEDSLLATGRSGDAIQYKIPVPNGLYSLRLSFAETQYSWSGERVFDILINGKRYASDFDIAEIARGVNVRLDRVYNNVLPGADGCIAIELRTKKNAALIQSIELAGEQRDTVHINCGSDDKYIDWAGGVWEADRYFDSGDCTFASGEVLQASPTLYDQSLYHSGRSGNDLTYKIPLREGLYSVHLKFAELWLEKAGQRKVDILVNGQTKKHAWDAALAAGYPRMAADVRFDDISPVDGVITIRIRALGENPAVIQAIECE